MRVRKTFLLVVLLVLIIIAAGAWFMPGMVGIYSFSARSSHESDMPRSTMMPGMMPPPPPASASAPASPAVFGMMGGMSPGMMAPMSGMPPAGPRNMSAQLAPPNFNTESYRNIEENPFLATRENPLSTFGVDVDTASYANMRRFLTEGHLPPRDAVRIEELVNYFPYQYAAPTDDVPFAVNAEVAGCPWSPAHRLLRLGLKGKEIPEGKRPPSNIVFLLDVSGSMQEPDKLPLLRQGMKLLVQRLDERDHLAIVVYAGSSGLVLPSTACSSPSKEQILRVIDQLEAGGSTQGSAGINQAYEVASQNFIKDGTNRVILATDGDFNVGVTNEGDLTRLIEEKAKSGVFLSVLGFGEGNLKDSMMEQLADKGNGNYAYIDSLAEARKALLAQFGSTLITIAKDVKIQVEFNPAVVGQYRLIGYENRMLRAEDFKDDKKDAGEIGAGHTVTALYELTPTTQTARTATPESTTATTPAATPAVDPLKYQSERQTTDAAASGELLTVKLRYKAPTGDTSRELGFPVRDGGLKLDATSSDFRFAAAVAEFGLLLRDSAHKGQATYDGVLALAQQARGEDAEGYRAEFITLVKNARDLTALTPKEKTGER